MNGAPFSILTANAWLVTLILTRYLLYTHIHVCVTQMPTTLVYEFIFLMRSI